MTKCLNLCGLVVEEPLKAGWLYLDVARAWRCGACVRAMDEVSRLHGTSPHDPGTDPLAKDDRGALKEPKGMMVQPSVRP